MLTQVFEWSKGFCFFFLLHSPEESCSNTRTADEGRQKRPIQQKILKPRYTNPPHYRQTSLANHRALPLQYGWLCSFTFWVCVRACVLSFKRPQQRISGEKQTLVRILQKCKNAEILSACGCAGQSRRDYIKRLTTLKSHRFSCFSFVVLGFKVCHGAYLDQLFVALAHDQSSLICECNFSNWWFTSRDYLCEVVIVCQIYVHNVFQDTLQCRELPQQGEKGNSLKGTFVLQVSGCKPKN